MLMQSLENALREAGDARHVVCLLTQVEVDPADPAFERPTKPVGFFYDEAEAAAISESLGWTMRDDAGRGWRYVVPSPRPKHIVDVSLIETVAGSGAVVIAGGGGIPVVRSANGARRGVEGVIDKDLSSAHMANVLGIEDFMILTSAVIAHLDAAEAALAGEAGTQPLLTGFRVCHGFRNHQQENTSRRRSRSGGTPAGSARKD